MSGEKTSLFQPLRVGRMDVKHRVVMAPMTRTRATTDYVPSEKMIEHYAMRAAIPGTLIISEANFVHLRDIATPFWRQPPGIWNAAQVRGWKPVVDAVHAKGSYFVCQLWSPGRLVSPDILESMNPAWPYVSAGTTQVVGYSRAPEEISKELMKEYVQWFADCATHAMEAGFDAVEFQALYFIEEFMKDLSNTRTDEYGFQNPENATRFFFEILDAIVQRVGEDRVGTKINPWAHLTMFDPRKQGDPLPVYTYLGNEVRRRYPNLAFLHVTEPRVEGLIDRESSKHESNDFLREIWKGKPYISDGGHNWRSARQAVATNPTEMAMFARWYTSNPDLPLRLEHEIPLTSYDRATFYLDGSEDGYNTYRWSEEGKKIAAASGIDVTDL